MSQLTSLQKIINGPVDMRIDLQCYARLVHLMAHFELGNDAIIESLIKSVFRFMSTYGKPDGSGGGDV